MRADSALRTGATRRGVLGGVVAGSFAIAAPRMAAAQDSRGPVVGALLPRWRPGFLDIHHLAGGRGDATVVVSPDGHVALIDAGAILREDEALVEAPREAVDTPGAWIADYVRRRMAECGAPALHSIAVTHLHADHVGDVRGCEQIGCAGGNRGVAAVAEALPVDKILDPAWPDYGYPPFEGAQAIEAYIAFLHQYARSGGRVETLEVGRTAQVLPRASKLRFDVRTVAARGRVWTGAEGGIRDVFPAKPALSPEDWPNENAMSAGLLFTYGQFRYFAGGDLTDWADAGTRSWMNALEPAARAIGPVDVSTLPHHGMFDGSGAATLAQLRARDWIISAWHAAHPSIETLERVFKRRVYEGERDVFSTQLHPAAELAMGRLTARFASKQGNVIARVYPGGSTYQVLVTDTSHDRLTHVSTIRPVPTGGRIS